MIASDFCAFILTHGRPDHVITYQSLRRCGYTGKIYLIIDDEDKHGAEYREKFGAENVIAFSKEEAAKTFDVGDNFPGRRGVVYARNAVWSIARKLGVRAFIELDDDYTGFYYRYDEDARYGNWRLHDLDALLTMLVEYLDATPFLSICMAQGGDHIGGGESNLNETVKALRKAMNTFVCLTDRPFSFVGRINEDVNAYVAHQNTGGAFLTLMAAMVVQKTTQANAGGMTELYLDSGTYVKSFYSVMYAPSCVTVAQLRDHAGEVAARLHHRIEWNNTASKILHERHRKSRRRPFAGVDSQVGNEVAAPAATP